MGDDRRTAAAFASSWNALPAGSIYTREQFEEWLDPLTRADVAGREVLELGCGNASLLVHMAGWSPAFLEGVELGDAVESAERNMAATGFRDWKVTRADLKTFNGRGFDVVYCIGVLHHLADWRAGLDAVIRNLERGGRFHCCVYAWEGNRAVRWWVEPLRRLCSRLPWWLTKYLVATPLAVPYYLYAKGLASLPRWKALSHLPLSDYSRWIARREFAFCRHVAFDQLVAPRTVYFRRETLERWLAAESRVEPDSVYLTRRNGNVWKFGGRVA